MSSLLEFCNRPGEGNVNRKPFHCYNIFIVLCHLFELNAPQRKHI